jgi:hypothetical protein
MERFPAVETRDLEGPRYRVPDDLPSLSKGYSLARPSIDRGMRAGITDLFVRQRTITTYTDVRALTRALDIPNRETVHVFLLDTHGSIVWRDSGEVDEAKVRLLAEALGEIHE